MKIVKKLYPKKRCISKIRRSTNTLIWYKGMIDHISSKYKEQLYYLDLINNLMIDIDQYIYYGNIMSEG